MKIRELLADDIASCAKILIAAYNPPPWNDHWTDETAQRYLSDFAASKDFIGFAAIEEDEIAGAMFAHRKTWWTNDEIFVDELFVSPDRQGHGCGKLLLEAAEQLARQSGWGGVTLLTNRHFPAKSFYEKNGYTVADHVIFMYKETH